MEILLIALIISFSNIACLIMGLKIRDCKEIKISNPVEMIKEHKENKEIQQEEHQKQKALETMLYNIEIYDGTEEGQRDIEKY